MGGGVRRTSAEAGEEMSDDYRVIPANVTTTAKPTEQRMPATGPVERMVEHIKRDQCWICVHEDDCALRGAFTSGTAKIEEWISVGTRKYGDVKCSMFWEMYWSE